MPGSRRSQVDRNLSIILDVARAIKTKTPDAELCLIAYDSDQARELSCRQAILPVFHENRYQVMKNCDLLIICSGTASLEAAVMKIPQIFFHHVSFFDDYIFRRFIHLREINLANLYFGEAVVPCLVSSDKRFLLGQLSEMIIPRLSRQELFSTFVHDR
jgi:lipid-A-disaccharide synthase